MCALNEMKGFGWVSVFWVSCLARFPTFYTAGGIVPDHRGTQESLILLDYIRILIPHRGLLRSARDDTLKVVGCFVRKNVCFSHPYAAARHLD